MVETKKLLTAAAAIEVANVELKTLLEAYNHPNALEFRRAKMVCVTNALAALRIATGALASSD